MTSPTEERLSDALHDIVATQPFEPDPAAIERRGRLLQRRARAARGMIGAGVVVVVALVAVTTIGMMRPGSTVNHQAAHTPRPAAPVIPGPLVRLADYLQANPPQQTGDATLIMRSTTYPGTAPIIVADLYADNGKYFFAQTRSGLPAEVRANHDQGNGIFAREIAVAIFAANGDLAVARQRMALADGATGPLRADILDDAIWGNAAQAVIAGVGNPQVRAGFLRIVSTLPEISVKNTTVDGQPALAIIAGQEMFAPNLPAKTSNHVETLTINAQTGRPIMIAGGPPGAAPDSVESYQISRVTLSDVAAGKF